MVSAKSFPLFCSVVVFFLCKAEAKIPFRPRALLHSIHQDEHTGLYFILINQSTPFVHKKYVIDLGGSSLWLACDKGYNSSTYKPTPCRSAQCNAAGTASCLSGCPLPSASSCPREVCKLEVENRVINTTGDGLLGQDVVSMRSTDGQAMGQRVTVSNFLFGCGPPSFLQGLPEGAAGVAGLGRSKVSLPYQFSAAFSFPRKFAICLPGSLFFGDGPYKYSFLTFGSGRNLAYTPLIVNPIGSPDPRRKGEPSSDYYIKVTSIRVNDTPVDVNPALLKIDEHGNGGTMFSTLQPYTTMRTSVFKAVIKTYTELLSDIPVVPPVAPFGVCYNFSGLSWYYRDEPPVPYVAFVLHRKKLVWPFPGYGSGFVTDYPSRTMCLPIVDGGENLRAAIVIGQYHMEDVVFQFDLDASRVGIGPRLRFYRLGCTAFNSTVEF